MRKGKSKTLGIRPGVKARVMVPERFIRCGYDLNPQIAGEMLLKDHEEAIITFLDAIGITWLTESVFDADGKLRRVLRAENRNVGKLLADLGYFYAGAKGFGGKERKIFSVPEPALEDKIVLVEETRQVMIGTYYAPSGGRDYDGDYWYEPGGLDGQESIKIARVRFHPDENTWSNIQMTVDKLPHQQWAGLWIDARDLEKIE